MLLFLSYSRKYTKKCRTLESKHSEGDQGEHFRERKAEKHLCII